MRSTSSTSTSSPAWCPYVSLTRLKWSTSSTISPNGAAAGAATACSSVLWKLRRLARPVSGSVFDALPRRPRFLSSA